MGHRPAILDQLDKIEEAVRLFDSHYDVQQLYSYVAELFRSVPRPEDTDSADLRWQFAYLGAAWAQIVTSVDLTYELGRGYQVHDESRDLAARLLSSPAVHPVDEVFGKQVLIRWHDASAKLYYRTGDHTTARSFWDKCLALLEAPDGSLIDPRLEFIYPDIKSSSERNQFEEYRQTTAAANENEKEKAIANKRDQLVADLGTVIKGTRGYFAKRYPDVLAYLDNPAANRIGVPDLLASLTIRDRERLRGLANLYQNSFKPHEVQRIAEFTNDQLGLMQALHEQARTAYKSLRDTVDLAQAFQLYMTAASLWKRVRDQAYWRRGHFFARQNLALLERDFGAKFIEANQLGGSMAPTHLLACLRELIALIDDIQSIGTSSEGDYAEITDVDLHGWTIDIAYKTLETLKGWAVRQDQAVVDEIESRVIDELQQMVRQHRQVIRVGVYKYAFAKFYRGLFHRIVQHYYDLTVRSKSYFPKLACWVEESSSRELLDIIAAQRRKAAPASAPVRTAPSLPDSEASDDANEARDERPCLRRLRQGDEGMQQRIVAMKIESEREFDEYAKRNPVAAAPISADIGDKAKQYCVVRQAVIVRFFQVSDHDYAAVVFYPNGSSKIRRLPPTAASPLNPAAAAQSENPVDQAMRLVRKVLAPSTGDDGADLRMIEETLPDLGRAAGAILDAVAPELFRPERDLDAGPSCVIVMPVGILWKVPFHAAIVDEQLFCTKVPLVYATSITALVEHNRDSGLTSTVQAGTIGVCTSYAESRPNQVRFGQRVVNRVRCGRGSVKVVGPVAVPKAGDVSHVSREALQALIQNCLSVLYLGCHGEYFADDLDRCCLVFHNSTNADDSEATTLITPEQLALMDAPSPIPLVILAACVSGQGVGLPGGEISGFYRAMAAMGAATCMLSFWPVDSQLVDDFAIKMMEGVRASAGTPLFIYQRAIANSLQSSHQSEKITGRTMMRLCCLALFL
jgi:hypothetical protein